MRAVASKQSKITDKSLRIIHIFCRASPICRKLSVDSMQACVLRKIREAMRDSTMWGRFCAFAVASALSMSGLAVAADNAGAQGALQSGGAAGTQTAISWHGNQNLLWLVGGGVVVGGIVLVATGNGHGSVGSSCTLPGCTSTSTTTTTTKTSTSTATATSTSTATTTTKTH